VLQTVDAGEIVDWARELPKAGTGEESQEMRTRRELAANIMKTLGLQPNLREAVLARDQWDSIDARLAEIETACEKETQIRDGKHKELVRLDSLKVKIKDLPLLGFSIEGRDAYSYLSVEMGRIADKNLALLKTKLEPILHTMVLLGTGKGTTTLIVVSLKRDKDKLHAALTEAGFSPFTLDQTEWMPTAEKIAELDGKIDGTHRDITKSDAQLDGIAKEHGAFLQSVLLRIRWENTKQNILRHFRRTEQTYVLSGWVPRQDRDTFTEALRRSTSGRCIVRDMPAEEVDSVRSGKVEVPVRLKNSAFFRPFELLTTLYGTPSYRSIDPTPLVGISYLIMFGIMFGDVGHGLVLALAGSFLALKAKSAGTKDAGRLVLFVGCSSMVFGVLFGSIFGFEEILPHLWFKPIDSIPRFLKTMILFGTGMVTMSVLLSIVNKIRKGQPFTAIFHRAGFVGLVVYWCSIALVLKSFSGRPTGPSSGTNPLVVVLAVCLVLIFFQEPIVRLLQGKKQ
ncbi:MAG TPA: V-type ATPase 116kDa subunit family protein, partial [bacterium]